MLFCLQWEIGPSRMQQAFPSYTFTELVLLLMYIPFKYCHLRSVLTFSTLQTVLPIFWIVNSSRHSISQCAIQKHFPSRLLHQSWARVYRYFIGRLICITLTKWWAWWCMLYVGLVKICRALHLERVCLTVWRLLILPVA
jgi:hypothetical protein